MVSVAPRARRKTTKRDDKPTVSRTSTCSALPRVRISLSPRGEAEFTPTDAFGKCGGVSYQAVEQEAVYEAAATDRFRYELIGSALYVGPTMHLQMGPKAFLSLAWSAQGAASSRPSTAERIEAWNQFDLSRQEAQMVFGIAF